MILKKLYHGNLKVCRPKNLLLLPLLIIVFLHQLTGVEIQIFVYHFKGSCLKEKKIIVHELDISSRDLNSDFISKDYLFEGVKLPKNADPDK